MSKKEELAKKMKHCKTCGGAHPTHEHKGKKFNTKVDEETRDNKMPRTKDFAPEYGHKPVKTD